MKKHTITAQRDVLAADLAAAEADLHQATSQVAVLQSALCWYADPVNYDEADGADMDRGGRARRALGRTAEVVAGDA